MGFNLNRNQCSRSNLAPLSTTGAGTWVVVYTERVICVCPSLLTPTYDEYRLWYVPPDIISFARELGMAMELPLGSRANVRELFEMIEVIKSTRFQDLPATWSDRRSLALDYHPGRTERGGDFLYYDPWSRQKIDEQAAASRASATRVILDDLECCWVHKKEDT